MKSLETDDVRSFASANEEGSSWSLLDVALRVMGGERRGVCCGGREAMLAMRPRRLKLKEETVLCSLVSGFV